MSKTHWLIALLSLGLLLSACPSNDDDDDDNDSAAADDDVADDDAADDDAADDDAADDDAADDDTAAGDICEDPEALRDNALNEGTTVAEGVALTESTPIGEILGDTGTYTGQLLQVEGFVTDICDNAGCWAEVTDLEGDSIILKVDDFYLDWRLSAEPGLWAVGEGTFDPSGGHGPQIYVVGYGAMIGTVNCLEEL